MTLGEGIVPRHSKAATAGVAMSRKPWVILDRAQNSFILERADRLMTELVLKSFNLLCRV
jgi:hypothetical protein